MKRLPPALAGRCHCFGHHSMVIYNGGAGVNTHREGHSCRTQSWFNKVFDCQNMPVPPFKCTRTESSFGIEILSRYWPLTPPLIFMRPSPWLKCMQSVRLIRDQSFHLDSPAQWPACDKERERTLKVVLCPGVSVHISGSLTISNSLWGEVGWGFDVIWTALSRTWTCTWDGP